MRKSHLSLTKPFSLREGTNFSGRNILPRHKSLARVIFISVDNKKDDEMMKVSEKDNDNNDDNNDDNEENNEKSDANNDNDEKIMRQLNSIFQ
ncbi:hypothetical protein GLOIN_2v1886404 [Rhizophagus clarus]|uniref:Uncharacterized protein n=1 Tax=Rhizophagus clarus TaxID=94130 RepID=A0A8H3LH26_9GLOM|nr:hypothetical protein GLOIN_2v1886404 [Rhizophagus clarus]